MCIRDRDGINDGNMKTGSLVTAFVNACYQKTGVPIVGVSASKGGSSILQWQPGTPYLSDTLRRLAKARRFLEKEGIFIRHTFMLWCQGETDGDHHMTAGDLSLIHILFRNSRRIAPGVKAENCII